jgi:hypothetical protein
MQYFIKDKSGNKHATFSASGKKIDTIPKYLTFSSLLIYLKTQPLTKEVG